MKKGFTSLTEKVANSSTVWGLKHLPQNRDVMMVQVFSISPNTPRSPIVVFRGIDVPHEGHVQVIGILYTKVCRSYLIASTCPSHSCFPCLHVLYFDLALERAVGFMRRIDEATKLWLRNLWVWGGNGKSSVSLLKGGDGALNLYKYNYPDQRRVKDKDDKPLGVVRDCPLRLAMPAPSTGRVLRETARETARHLFCLHDVCCKRIERCSGGVEDQGAIWGQERIVASVFKPSPSPFSASLDLRVLERPRN